MFFQRWILRILFSAHVTHVDIYRRAGQDPVSEDRDATKQETPAFLPRRALRRRETGPRESSECKDRALLEKLEETGRGP